MLEKQYPGILSYLEPVKDAIAWTVLRDPYERFLDALSYDIWVNDLMLNEDTLNKVIGDNYKLRQYILGVSDPETRVKGRVRHSMLQTTYLMNVSLDYFVLDMDLGIFCDMHFPNIRLNSSDMNLGTKEGREYVREFLYKYPHIDKEVRNYLAIDYFLLDRLRANGRQWHWANGKIF